ncbi:hypothetical protein BCR43DRAFT_359381 [Syncephalastrum racemosum]|uniref:SAP domain-containing protein n=1 Tax=Syncephalastrum racemosum TaxID=13706 RepID=A0A1X2H6V9_SYNRA|nr:hypothetical protein BCR43DRAFT_359381 [Syncephalastrum racemosum]
MLFLDLDHLMPVEKRFRRRRSSSVPPLAHSVYQQQIQQQIQQQQLQQQQPIQMPSQPPPPQQEQQHHPHHHHRRQGHQQHYPRSLSPSDTMAGSSLPLAQQHQVQLASLLAQSMPPPTQPPPARSVQIERIARRAAPQVDPQERQRQMIHRLRHVNFEDVTVAELKSLLRFCHLSTTGRKQELIERLKAHHRDA